MLGDALLGYQGPFYRKDTLKVFVATFSQAPHWTAGIKSQQRAAPPLADTSVLAHSNTHTHTHSLSLSLSLTSFLNLSVARSVCFSVLSE